MTGSAARVALDRRTLLRTTGAGVLASVLGGCGTDPVVDTLRIACGEPRGIYIEFGRLLGRVAVDTGIARSFEAQVTEGSLENVDRVLDGRADVGLTLADSADGREGLAAIGRVYQNYLQVVVRDDGPVRTVRDLAGLPVSLGAPGSGTAATATTVFTALGLLAPSATRPLQRRALRLDAATDALASGDIAALVFSSGIPIPALRDVVDSVRVLSLRDAYDRLPTRLRGVITPATIPARTYATATPTPTLGVANLLVTRRSASRDLAHDLAALCVRAARELVPAATTGVQYLSPDTLVDTGSVQLHPGAERAYVEARG